MLIDFKTALFACLLIVIGSHASASNIIAHLKMQASEKMAAVPFERIALKAM